MQFVIRFVLGSPMHGSYIPKKKVDDVPLSKKEQHEKQNELLRSQ